MIFSYFTRILQGNLIQYNLVGDVMKKIIEIAGMKCEKCANRVENKFKDILDSEKVKVNLENHNCIIDDEGMLTDTEIKEIISDLGYEVTSIK